MTKKFHPGPPDVYLDFLSDLDLQLGLKLTIKDQELADEAYKLLSICIDEDIAGLENFISHDVSSGYIADWMRARYNARLESRKKSINQIANKLRENMIAKKIYPPGDNFDAHHIVGLNDRRAHAARDVLTMFGIDINSPENGVYLPSEPKYVPHFDMPNVTKSHSETHSDLYHRTVLRRLNATVAKGGDRDKITKTLRKIASELEKGIFPI